MHRAASLNQRVLLMGALLLACLLAAAAAVAQTDDAADGTTDTLDAEAVEDAATDYYAEVALMLGRLEAAHALYRNGDRAAGGRQLAALAEEHLPVVREALRARDLDLLVRRIENLAGEARQSNSWIKVQDLHEASRMSLQRAMTQVDADTREEPAFKADIVLAIARAAVRQYALAVDGGEFVQPRAYQTGYGYITYGRTLLERNAGLLGQVEDELHTTLVEHYEALTEAWPSIRLPAEPPLSVDVLRERLSALEDAAERF